MCGKFAENRNLERLKNLFPIDKAACDLTPNLDIAPGRELLAIIRQGGKNRLDKFHWGLIPFWAGTASIGKNLINARAETIAEKPSFREAFKYRRCLIPADGFYEWQGSKNRKQPLFIVQPNRKPFAFAGLWETRHSGHRSPPRCQSCAIITTRASQSFSAIHHRMPVILKPQVYHQWLDTKNQDLVELAALLQNQIITEWVSFPVPQPKGASQDLDPSRPTAVGRPQQMTFDWPKPDEPQQKR
ncbi:Gifsy-2 prophage protein [Olavius algarvensis Delta 1 endosymbiont]|nr:Gifsy-2 prophage protein [Olavius algarvensis Delta 1 endosymbiont]